MQDFHERKARMNLDKQISKKVQRAEKNKEKALKDHLTKIRTKLLAPVDVIQAKQAQERRTEFKETMNLIRDASHKDILESQRMAQLKAAKENELKKYMSKEKEKRERARMFRDEEDRFLRSEVEERLEEYEEKHQFSKELRLH